MSVLTPAVWPSCSESDWKYSQFKLTDKWQVSTHNKVYLDQGHIWCVPNTKSTIVAVKPFCTPIKSVLNKWSTTSEYSKLKTAELTLSKPPISPVCTCVLTLQCSLCCRSVYSSASAGAGSITCCVPQRRFNFVWLQTFPSFHFWNCHIIAVKILSPLMSYG